MEDKQEIKDTIEYLETTIEQFDNLITMITKSDADYVCHTDLKIINNNITKPKTKEDFMDIELMMKSFNEFLDGTTEIKTILKTQCTCAVLETIVRHLKMDLDNLKTKL